MPKPTISHERLLEALRYEPATGVFRWRVMLSKRGMPGAVAGTLGKQMGYVVITIATRHYQAHRLAWFYMTGEWPKADTDHIDGNRANNAWANLRDVPRTVNNQNQKRAHVGNTTGVLGVHYSAQRRKFVAQIVIDRKQTPLGRYDTLDEAAEAYLAAKRRHHEGNTL